MPTIMSAARRIARDRDRYDPEMLPPPFRWRIDAEAAFLDFNAGNVAHVQRWGGQLTLTIRWQGHTVGGPVASIGQGVRYAERWIGARPGMPGKRPRRWYDEVHERRVAAEALRVAQPRHRSRSARDAPR